MKNPDHPARIAAEHFEPRRYDVTTADNVIHTVEAIDAESATLMVSLRDVSLGILRVVETVDPFTHTLDWNGSEWWVTTRKNGQPWSGMPLTYFMEYRESEYHA
jgi:hypothetical protein